MNNSTIEGNFSDNLIFYGLKTGTILGFKLSIVYAFVLGLLFMVGSLNPIIFGLTFLYALILGVIPAVFTGALSGTIIGLLHTYASEPLSERKTLVIGWSLGILFALLLPFLILFFLRGGEFPAPEENFQYLRGFGLLMLCPSIITVFSVGWLVRKIGVAMNQEG